MGLSNSFRDASSDSIPLLILLSVLSFLSHLRSLLLSLLPNSSPPPSDLPPHFPSAVGSRLASLALLSDRLSSIRPFPCADAYADADRGGCVFCLDDLRKGDQIRRLSCCHVFHSHCLDGWFDTMNLTCPLCRSPLVPPEDCRKSAEMECRIGADLVSWLSPY